MTTSQTVRLAMFTAAVALVAGTLAGAVRGHVTVLEAVGGAGIAAAFFASSAIVARNTPVDSLKRALLHTYIIKVSLLASTGVLVASIDLDRPALAVAIVSGAVAYAAGLVWLNRRPR